MKSLLTALHVERGLRPRRTTWFEDEEVRDEVAAETIGTLVHAPAHTVGEHAPIAGIVRLLVEQDVPAVAVVDAAGAMCGVITSTDLLAAGDDWTAADAMSSVIGVRASTPIDEVAELMAREHASFVVVTDAVGQVVGIVTARAITRHRASR